MNKNDETCAKVLREVEDSIAKGVLPWQKPWVTKPPVNAISNKPYRGINYLALTEKEYSDNRWLTFKQALELNGSVRKGEKGTMVVYWHFPNRQSNDTPNETITSTKKVSYETVWAKMSYVFNVEQCDNLQLPQVEAVAITPIEAAVQVHMNYLLNGGPRVKHGGDKAYYSPMFDSIQLPKITDFQSPQEYHGVRFHEEIHSTGHSSRLERGFSDNAAFGSELYSIEELIAELGSAMLRAITGIPTNVNNSAAYISGWQKAIKNEPNILVKAASKAQKAIDLIVAA